MTTRTPLLAFSAVAALMVGVSLPDSEARTWTQAETGRKIEADFVGVEGDQVVLSVNGKPAKVPLKQLSEEDQAFVAEASAKVSGETAGSAVNNGKDWPKWRGADGSDIAPAEGIKDEWPDGGPSQLWVYDGAGMGYSSFSVVDGTLYTMGTRGEDVYVVSVDTADGEEIWATKISEDDQQGYSAGWGHGPRSTPTFDNGKIYALGPKGELVCLSAADGSKVWSKNLVDDFGGKWGGWGYAESPLVDGDKVVVGPGGQDAGIVALNKETGATIWKATDVKPGKAEYASIVPTEMHGKRQYIRLFESEVVSVDAETGEVLWRTEWPGKTAVIPTPIVDGNEVFITSGYGVGCKLVRVSEGGETEDVWVNKEMKNHHGGVVKIGDYLYGFSDGAGLICQEWDTGEMVWNEKGQGKLIKGAVHAVGDQLVCLNEDDGTVTLVDASPDGFEMHGQFQLSPQSENRNPKGKVWAHPVIVDGKLFLRDQEYVVAFDVKKG